jgi:hypothetical protein
MSSAILLMVLNFIGLGGGPTLTGVLSTAFYSSKLQSALSTTAEQAGAYMKLKPAEVKALPENVQAAIGASNAEGLRDALFWMTPFFVIAVLFIALQALAIQREVKADGAVSDGGSSAGILLLLTGIAGLGARYYFGGVAGMMSTDVMPLVQIILLAVATVLGIFLILGAGGRKKAVASFNT